MVSLGLPHPLDICGMSLQSLRKLHPSQLNRLLTEDEISHVFRECGALWLHSGDPKLPHAQLTSGKCSNGFVNTLGVLRHTNFCLIMADQIVRRLPKDWVFERNDWGIGSDHASATLSFAVSSQLGIQHDFTEKGPEGTQLWRRFPILEGERAFQIEELVTTLKTFRAVRAGVRQGNPRPVQFTPFVFTLVHRSNEYFLEDSPVHYVVHYDIQTWDGPDACPLCTAGSKRLRPKENWAELTRQAA